MLPCCLWRHAQSPLHLRLRQGPPLALLDFRSQGAGLWGCTRVVHGLPCSSWAHHVSVMQKPGAVHLYYLDTSLCAEGPCQVLCILHLHYSIRSFWQLCTCIEGHTYCLGAHRATCSRCSARGGALACCKRMAESQSVCHDDVWAVLVVHMREAYFTELHELKYIALHGELAWHETEAQS